MKDIDTGVFDRVGRNSMSDRVFYALLSFFIMWGLAGTAVAAHQTIELGYEPSGIMRLLIGLGIPILGVVIALQSDDWFVSFIGYNLIVIPFGIVLAPMVKQYNPTIVRDVCFQTALITSVMGCAGMTFPKVFRGLGNVLFIALLGLVAISVAQMFVPAWRDMRWVHYVAIGIFSLYIGYDFHRAASVPRTVDNAVDIAVSIYLDVINLFVRLLALSKKD